MKWQWQKRLAEGVARGWEAKGDDDLCILKCSWNLHTGIYFLALFTNSPTNLNGERLQDNVST